MRRSLKMLLISLCGFIPLQIYLIAVWLPSFLSYSNGLSNLDSRFSYSANDVVELVNALGSSGAEIYNRGVVIDTLYALFMALLVYTLLKIARYKTSNKIIIRLTYLIPLIYLVADWFENLGIALFINNLDRTMELIPLFSGFTMLKQSMALVAFGYLLFLIIKRFLIKKNKVSNST